MVRPPECKCKEGYYDTGNFMTGCILCESPCLGCRKNKTNCLSCVEGYYRYDTGDK